MPATTLKLAPALKARIASVIEGTGKSPHAFMLDAIEQQTTLAERRKAFVASALAARREALRTGKAYALQDVRSYYTARVAGKTAKRSRLKRWRA